MTDPVTLYLDMIKRSLTDSIYWDDPLSIYRFFEPKDSPRAWKRYSGALLQKLLNRYKIRLVKPYCVPGWSGDYSQLSRDQLANIHLLGHYCRVRAHTMIGLKRRDNLQFCVGPAIRDGISGDLIETGV